ncbi:macrophage mannose receptor 1-like [Xyrichtys novacula]|nr:macrophage mannose receptor 1-like [Xyrichtys novacula]
MDEMYLLLLLSGLCSLSSCVIEFKLFQNPMTWDEARAYCREECVDLATVDDMEEMQAALKAVKGGNGVWIGLQKGSQRRWHWSLTQKDFYKAGEKDYLIWGQQTDNNCGSYKNGLLYSVSCDRLYFAVCFDETKQGQDRYVLSSGKMDWMAAREYCRTHYTDLTSVRNEEESQILQEVVGAQQVWIGLFRDPWEWSDGSSSSFRHWMADLVVFTDLTVKECVIVRGSGRWEPQKCTDRRQFLCSCEKSFKQFHKVKISSKDSGLDLNDPAVKEAILKHTKQQLSGANVGVVQWSKHPDKREPDQSSSSGCKLFYS